MDVFNQAGGLLIEKNVPLRTVAALQTIKAVGIYDIPIDSAADGGLWDANGNPLPLDAAGTGPRSAGAAAGGDGASLSVQRKIRAIAEQKQEAYQIYRRAKENIKKVIDDIKRTGGEFDIEQLEGTVSDIFDFLTRHDTAFAYLTKEIFSYDDYLYNHSVNVCTIGTAVLKRFNAHFSEAVNSFLAGLQYSTFDLHPAASEASFVYYTPAELQEMALGYFLHDVGKVLIPDALLNKSGRLSRKEQALVQTHSFEKGAQILEKNRLSSHLIHQIVCYHHGPLFTVEPNCYPTDRLPRDIPSYVKVCKLADIYDAMTSRRSYKEAMNPVGVVTGIFRKFANRDRMLQFILHAFVRIVGIYPPGSIIYLQNGQMAFVLNSEGPIVIPFTDRRGAPLAHASDPVDLGADTEGDSPLRVDRRRPLKSPSEVYSFLPGFLKDAVPAPGPISV